MISLPKRSHLHLDMPGTKDREQEEVDTEVEDILNQIVNQVVEDEVEEKAFLAEEWVIEGWSEEDGVAFDGWDGTGEGRPRLKRLICTSRSSSAEAALSRCSLDSPSPKRFNGDAGSPPNSPEAIQLDPRCMEELQRLMRLGHPVYLRSDVDRSRPVGDEVQLVGDNLSVSSSFSSASERRHRLLIGEDELSDGEDEDSCMEEVTYSSGEEGSSPRGSVASDSPCTGWANLKIPLLRQLFDYLTYCDIHFCGLVNSHWERAVAQYFAIRPTFRLRQALHFSPHRPLKLDLHRFCIEEASSWVFDREKAPGFPRTLDLRHRLEVEDEREYFRDFIRNCHNTHVAYHVTQIFLPKRSRFLTRHHTVQYLRAIFDGAEFLVVEGGEGDSDRLHMEALYGILRSPSP